MYIYRADGRGPAEIKRDGFGLRGEAENTLEKYSGVGDYFRRGLGGPRANDVQRAIINSPDPGRPTVSTALDDGCGGQVGRRTIYKIEINGLHEIPINVTGKGNLTVYADEDSLDDASCMVIDLHVDTKEVVYIGPGIPPASILEYKQSGGGWKKMSTQQPAPPAVGKMKIAWPPKR